MNKMAEKNDQKMRERAERAEKFQAKLQELLALAKKKKNMLEYQEINDHFSNSYKFHNCPFSHLLLFYARPTLPTTCIFCMTYFLTSSIPAAPYFFGS